ncbi:MAG: hypothetical protein QF473_26845 [Planctomycetota bacterium]|jgi:hypothetical protein|nr:hypothetical protein [Planctomycetota bacterium]
MAILGGGACAEPAQKTFSNPRILFSYAELPALQKQRKRPRAGRAWQRIKAICQGSIKPETGLVVFLSTADADLTDKLELQHRVLRGIYYNALAYAVSGEEAYGYNARNLLMKLLRVFPAEGLDWTEGHASMGTFALIYDWIYPLLKPGEITELRGVLSKACRKSYFDWRKNWSRFSSVLEGSPYDTRLPIMAARLGLAALALEKPDYDAYDPDLPPEELKWSQRALLLVGDYLGAGISPEGAFHAGLATPLYRLDEVALFVRAMRRREVPIFEEAYLAGIGHWLIQETTPWPYEFSYGDEGQSGLAAGSFMAMLASRYGGAAERVFQRAYSVQGGFGIEPSPLSVFLWPEPESEDDFSLAALPDEQYYNTTGEIYMRNGWGRDDLALRIKTSQIASPNADGSQGSFTLSAYGAHLVTHTGHKERSAFSHNNVFINEMGQAVDAYGATETSVLTFLKSEPCALARVDIKPAYDSVLIRHPETGGLVRKDHYKVTKADRTFLMIKKDNLPYVILYDDMRKDVRERAYDLLIHTARGNVLFRNRKSDREDWMFITEPYGNEYLSCTRGSFGGGVKFDFRVLKEDTYWGWMLLRGALPKGGRGAEDLWPMVGDSRVPPHPSNTSWLWKQIQFHERKDIGLPLKPGDKDLFISGNQGTWVAGCMLTPAKDFVPVTMDSSPKEGSVLLTPGRSKISPPWQKVSDTNGAARLSMILLEPRQTEISTIYAKPLTDYPILQSRLRGTEGRFITLMIPGNEEVPLPKVLARKVSEWGSLLKLEWQAKGHTVIDTLHFSRKDLTRDKDFKTDAKVAFFRQYTGGEGAFGMLAMSQGTFVEIQKIRYIDGFGTPFSMIDDGHTIQITGPKLVRLKLHMPAPRKIILNGKVVRYTRDKKGFAYVKIYETVIPEVEFDEED